MENSKYFLYIAILFVATLLISNTVAVKLIQIGPFILNGAIFIFPISYIFGDVLTEVYGYKQSRKIIWSGFFALALMSFCYMFVQYLPSPAFWADQDSYNKILGAAPRIVIASMIAFWMGEFCNSYVISKMKVLMKGNKLWTRTISSTAVGQGVDTVVFVMIAFYGTMPTSALLTVIGSGYLFKVCYEALATPITYKIVGWLKEKEGVDTFDYGVKYNPFKI